MRGKCKKCGRFIHSDKKHICLTEGTKGFTGRRHTEESKDKIREKMKKRKHNWGNKISKTLTGRKRTAEECKNISEAKKGIPSFRKGISKIEEFGLIRGLELIENCRQRMLGHKRNKESSIKQAISIQKTMKLKFKDDKYKLKKLKQLHRGLKTRPNKPEKILIDIVNKAKLGFIYVGDGSFWLTRNTQSFNPDFLNNKIKCIIEVFGDYWHNLPNYKETDIERLQIYKKYGYETLVIWEHELRKNKHGNKLLDNEIISKINRFTHQHGD